MCTEFLLASRTDHFDQRDLFKVAQTIARLHVVITGEEITVVFHGQGRAAGLFKNAEARPMACIASKRNIKNLHEDPAHIMPHPLLKYLNQKSAVLLCCD